MNSWPDYYQGFYNIKTAALLLVNNLSLKSFSPTNLFNI